MRRLLTPLALSLSLSLAACGQDPEGGPEGTDPATEPGTTPEPGTDPEPGTEPAAPPTLADASPADGAVGVRPDAVVVLVFDQPMDAPSVEAALDASSLGAVTAGWSADATTLTLTPDQPLPLAEGFGVDPTTLAPLAFEVRVGPGAESAAGVPLAAEIVVGFATLRRIGVAVGAEAAATGHVFGDDFDAVVGGAELWVGDASNDTPIVGLASFDWSALPAGATEVESATWTARLVDTFGNAGTIDEWCTAEHVRFADLGEDAVVAAPLAAVGPFATWSTPSIALDVTPFVQDDLAHRADAGDRSQFRLVFPSGTNGDGTLDYYAFDLPSLELSVTVLAP